MFGAIRGFTTFIIITVIILFVLSTCIRVVLQTQTLVVERLGAYLSIYSVGIHFLAPFIDHVAKKINPKERVEDFPPQPVITKGNVTMQVDMVVFFYITDPKLYAYDVEHPLLAIGSLTTTTLRNIIDNLELGGTLAFRKAINAKVQESLDIATNPRDIKVTRVELKNIVPPAATQGTVEKQMKTEHRRRESVLRTEGEKKSTVLAAESHRESAVLNTEGRKEAVILTIKAEKEKKIREAEGQAEAIRSIQKAMTGGIHLIKEAGTDNTVLQLKSLEAFQAAANGEANKIAIPLDIQGTASLVKSITEVASRDEAAE